MENLEPVKALFHFNLDRVMEFYKAGLTLDLLYVLDCIRINGAVELEKYPKMAPYLLTLQRKGYLTEDKLISKHAEELFEIIASEGSISVMKKEKKEKVVTDFDKFWAAFPTSDAYSEAGFGATRTLKADKEKCKELVAKILAQGEYTIEDLIMASQTEVRTKQKETLKTKQNKLSYIQNSATWLRQRTFESWIEISKTTKPEEPTKKLNQSFNI